MSSVATEVEKVTITEEEVRLCLKWDPEWPQPQRDGAYFPAAWKSGRMVKGSASLTVHSSVSLLGSHHGFACLARCPPGMPILYLLLLLACMWVSIPGDISWSKGTAPELSNTPALLPARKRDGEAVAKGRCLLLGQKLPHDTLIYTPLPRP